MFKLIRFGPVADFKDIIQEKMMNFISQEAPDKINELIKSLLFDQVLGALGLSDNEMLAKYSESLKQQAESEMTQRNLEELKIPDFFPMDILKPIENIFYGKPNHINVISSSNLQKFTNYFSFLFIQISFYSLNYLWFWEAIQEKEKYWSFAALNLLKDEFIAFIETSVHTILDQVIFGNVKDVVFQVVDSNVVCFFFATILLM